MAALVFAILSASAFAHPVTSNGLIRHQAAKACYLGYYLENGGTTGGCSTLPVTVSDLTALETAASADRPTVIIISDSISGSSKVSIASDKMIISEASSSK